MVRRRIAVVGCGITGLAAARALASTHDVELFEASSSVGGHARSVHVGGVDADTGFIVFNETTYPRFAALVRELGLESRPTDMTFSLQCERCGVEYGSGSFRALFARRRNVVSPAHLRLLGGILRFFRAARRDLAGGWLGDLSLGDYLERRAVPADVTRHCVVPMTAAIWSTSAARVPSMHAAMVLGFLLRHGFLGIRNEAWRTVRGGCRAYLERLVVRLGAEIHLATPVRRIRREPDAVVVEADGRPPARYDGAVLATHTDTSLRMLADPSDDERRILGAIRYGQHETVVHTDESRLPRRVAARSAWNYRVRDCAAPDAPLEVTYWLDRLQGFTAPGFRCVTLNPDPAVDPRHVVTTHDDAHPILDVGAVVARRELPLIQGARRTFFCGAWQYDGFHEDGLRSGLEAAALAAAGRGALVA